MLALALAAAEEAVRAIASSAPPPGVLGLAVPARLLDGAPGSAYSEVDVDVGAGFRERFGVPVKVITSQGAAAIAEHRVGAAQGAASLLFTDVGNDIQAALVSGGQARHLFNAGHLVINSDGPRCQCGQRGCWQALAGYEGLVTRVLSAISRGALSPLADLATGGPQAVTAAAVCRLAAGGDALARDVVEETGRYLALGLANLISLLGPEVVMIAGSPAPVVASLRHAAEVELKLSQRPASLSRCVFLSPQLGETGPAIGAAIWASSQPD
jgi:glucokinase